MTAAICSSDPTHADAQDRALFDRVLSDDPLKDCETIAPPLLADIALSHGMDYATAAIYLRCRFADKNRAACDAILNDTLTTGDPNPHIVIMPGAFHLHHQDTGADAKNVREMAKQLGWTSEVVNVGSLGSLQTNADALIQHLANCPAQSIILVSLSKGSADVVATVANDQQDKIFSKVRCWISLSGLTFGTPLVGWLRRQWWRMPIVRLMLWSKGLRFNELDEIDYAKNPRLSEPPVLPAGMNALHVVGFPCQKHLQHRWAHRAYKRVAPLGPNDGGGFLLADADRLPGQVVPIWGADHYLNPAWDFSPVLRNILLHTATSNTAASAIPATKSTK